MVAGSSPSDVSANRSQHLHNVAVDSDAVESVAADGDARSSSVATASTPCPAQAFLAEPDESAAQKSSLAEATTARTTGTFGAVKQRPLTSHIEAKPAAAVRVCWCLCTILWVVQTGLGTHMFRGMHRPKLVWLLSSRLGTHTNRQAMWSASLSLPARSARFA